MNTRSKTDKTAQGKPELPTGETLVDHVYNRKTMAYEPQGQHSPLPWRTVVETEFEPCAICDNDGAEMVHLVGGSRRERASNAKLIVASVNHVEALADALREVDKAYQEMFDVMPVAFQTYAHIVEKALAKWEGAKS